MSSTGVSIGAMCIAFVIAVSTSLSAAVWVFDRLRLYPKFLFGKGYRFVEVFFSPFAILTTGFGVFVLWALALLLPEPSFGWAASFIPSVGFVLVTTILTRVFMPDAYAKYGRYHRYLRSEVGHDDGIGVRIMQRLVFDRVFFHLVFVPIQLAALVAIVFAWQAPSFWAWFTKLSGPGVLGSALGAVVLFLVGECVFVLVVGASSSSPGDEWH